MSVYVSVNENSEDGSPNDIAKSDTFFLNY